MKSGDEMKKSTCSYMGIAMVILVCLSVSSCIYKHYTGRYWVGKTSQTFSTKDASYEDNQKMLQAVRDIAKDFGFVEHQRKNAMPDIITFGKGEKTHTKFNTLYGSDAVISLFISTGFSPEIGIQDLSYIEETEFVRTFKSQLETRLNEVVDMKNVRFIREFDFLN